MNKPELIKAIAQHAQLTPAKAEQALAGIVTVIEQTLKQGDAVTVVGFGQFEVKARAERQGRNPQTGEAITIAAARVPGFKPGKALKDAVNQG